MSTILITGGAGYIGSHVTWALLDAGYPVVAIDDLSAGRQRLLPPSVPLIQAGCADTDALKTAFNQHSVDTVMHLAASISVAESVSRPAYYYENNVSNTLHLASLCLEHGVKHLILASSASVYGNGGAQPLPEEARPDPVSPYGAGKMMAERMLLDIAAATGLAVTCLRYFNVAGADKAGRTGDTKRGGGLFKVLAEWASGKRDHVNVNGVDYPTADGTAVRDYIHVSDIAAIHVLALEHRRQGTAGKTGQVFNCGLGKGYSVSEVIDSARRVAGKEVPVRQAGNRPGDPAVIIADTHKLQDELGFRPQIEMLDDMMRTSLAWERTLTTP